MKILLVQPPHRYGKWERGPNSFPLGLAYIAKIMMNSGHHVEIFDIWANQYTNDEVSQKIKEFDYDIIGISGLSTQYAYLKWFISEFKKHHEAPTIVGGALATLTPQILLEHTQADICVIGEGEITFKNVVENISKLEGVNGIHFKRDGKIVKNKPQEYIKDLDSIEFPAWDIFPMDVYLKYCRVHGTNVSAMNIIAGRGCPYNCRFCSKTFHGARFRSIGNIIQEVETLIKRYGIGGIGFSDELVVINKDRMYELCEKIEPLGIKWSCQGRSNLVDFELLKRMKETGCVAVGYGVESGSQVILNNMRKQITVQQSSQAIEDTIKLGMYPIVQLMYGYPGENKDTLRETEQFLTNLPYVSRATLSITTPLPGNELWDYAISRGLIKNKEQYLNQLAGGYTHDSAGPLINFTDFSEEEFYSNLKKIEKRLFMNKVRKYPHKLAKDYLSRGLKQYRSGGRRQLIKRFIRFMSWVS